MKHTIHSKFHTWTIALITILCCWNGSMVNTDSSEKTAGPDINFYGTLEDHTHTTNIESILIGGKYESIPVYQQVTPALPATTPTQEIDPKQNKTLVNLQDITSISLLHPDNPTASSIKVNNKIYIQIVIESLHGTKKQYLVESTRKITCNEIDKSAEIEKAPTLQVRDINFIHVKKLAIKGYKSNYPYQSSQLAPMSKESHTPTINQEKNKFKNNTAELLNAIEENVKNLPLDNPTAFETMRSTILILLKSLRDQLQKFLDMIK